MNLYSFVGNDSINKWDVLGRNPDEDIDEDLLNQFRLPNDGGLPNQQQLRQGLPPKLPYTCICLIRVECRCCPEKESCGQVTGIGIMDARKLDAALRNALTLAKVDATAKCFDLECPIKKEAICMRAETHQINCLCIEHFVPKQQPPPPPPKDPRGPLV